MINDSVGKVERPFIADRAAIRKELETTRIKFKTLLQSCDESRWHRKSPTSDWTTGEIMVHITWALEQLPQEIASAKRGKGMFNMPSWLADPLSYWFTRWMARKATPKSVVHRYDAAMDAVLRTLDNVEDGDWGLGAPFYGHGFYTITALFHTPAEHLAEHAVAL